MNEMTREDELEALEIELLLDGIRRWYGYDFREYGPAFLKRRVRKFVRSEQLDSVSVLLASVLHDVAMMERLLLALSVNATTMFRDPGFYRALREKVVPLLRTYPFLRIWEAGCSTGEEAYSTAIVLEEEGLYDRCRIYATDLNPVALRRAREGVYSMSVMKEYTANYLKSGGRRCFSDYYTAGYDSVIFRQALKRNIVFAQHNLTTDASFNEFHFILCRNVMIYFQAPLKQRVMSLLHNSLCRFGVLALGNRESFESSARERCYEAIDPEAKLFRKVA